MKIFSIVFALFLGLSTQVKAEDTDSKNQEYYDKQVAENLQLITAELQSATNEMIKYINAMNKALNESMPQISENMGKIIASMRPLAETMQKNTDAFTKEIQEQLENQERTNIVAPEDVIIPEDFDISEEIDKELATLHTESQNLKTEPQKKIKLFSSSVE